MAERKPLKDGIAQYLEARVNFHNGQGYKKFENMYTDHATQQEIADVFGVDRTTVVKWVKQYKSEKGKA